MYHLAQVNIARALYPLDDPAMSGFVSRIEEVNALAESAPGFVWRFKDEEPYERVFAGERLLFNMSVWQSVEALREFTYGGLHRELFRDRAQWFARFGAPALAMWWVPAGTRPSVEDAKQRLDHLAAHGESDFAFTFRRPFAAPEAKAAQRA